ncbi:MAG: hypothetical protein ABGX83_01140 [Nitrospira sp.]|nr:hypothetical protein [Candidatus Manganitrophaceae bacterium]HIL35160.1 hypothetical protein [Candidatus Manganitrophaceae bacterium]
MKFFRWYNTVLVILSCFLQWIQPKIFVTNISGIETFDGKLVFGLGVIGFLAASGDLIIKGGRFAWLTNVTGFIVFIIISMLFYDYSRNEYVLGPGMYLAAMGSLQLTGAYVASLFKKGGQTPSGE